MPICSNIRVHTQNKIRVIEEIFIEELTFLFYLNLNNTTFPPSGILQDRDLLEKSDRLNFAMIERYQQIHREVNSLVSPKHCLMEVISKNNDIKQWFSERISDVTSYRSQTLDKMSKFYNEVVNSHQNRVIPEQQDLTNIFSDSELPMVIVV